MKKNFDNVEQKIALAISGIFHPLMMPVYLYIAYFKWFSIGYYPVDISFQNSFLVVLIIISFIFPILAIAGLFFLKKISSMMLYKRNDRVFPFLITKPIQKSNVDFAFRMGC